MNEPLRVVRLEAENFKRLKAVEITPDPASSTVTIAGRNAQGKSSVIDAIWAALSNASAAKGTGTVRPIRDGETSATVTVDLGDIVVTRVWRGEKTTLTVANADGAKYSSPQRMLDELIGRLSFDPLAFAGLPPKQQQAELLGLVELPFDPTLLGEQRASTFSDRTEVGRLVKQLRGQLDGFAAFPVDTPTEFVSVRELLAELDGARAAVRERQEAERRVDASADDVVRAERTVQAARQALADAEEELDVVRKDHALQVEDAKLVAERTRRGDDVDAIRERIDNAESINAAVRQLQERDRVAGALADAEKRYEDLTAEIARLDQERADGLAQAEFPVDGLGFDDSGVTYQGVPFAQASAAEQLRVSVAIAMALNPTVRVIRIADGSLLDSENVALIGEMAADRGYQVWLETVRDAGADGPGIVIEDGQVAEQ